MMKEWVANFRQYIPLLYELVIRDIKIKYRRSVLGVLWTILNPLLMMTVMSIVFSHFFGKFNIENYPIYLLSGQVIFNFYSEATSMSMPAILNNAPLLKKVYIPKYMFVLSKVISGAINLLAAFAALLIVMFVMRVELHYTAFLSIIPLVFLVIMCIGVGLVLATLVVKFRDIMHLYTVFLTALMYLTPIIYPADSLPGWVNVIVNINPLTGILTMFRCFMIYGTMPEPLTICMTIIPSLVMLIIGGLVFWKNQDDFVLYI